jgi:hypothetical protein
MLEFDASVGRGESPAYFIGLIIPRLLPRLLHGAFDKALTDALDGAYAAVQRLGDAGVLPGGAAVGLVGLKQDADAGQRQGRALAGGQQAGQVFTLIGGQRDEVLLLLHITVNSSVAVH